jgi:hypothetical protein
MGKIRKNNILERIYFIRNEKVMLDADLALLYGVETRVLKQAVRRNIERFPDDFMFELTEEEISFLVSQNVIPSKKIFGGARPFAFTEQGVAMISGVLKSKRAIEVNITIMRAFIQLRRMSISYQKLEGKIAELENKYDKNFTIVFEALKLLIKQKNEPRKPIGYKSRKNESEE